jgi:BirA family biotin operon repressor/biotin-[acetyl-CoA-carboxylase] ligase
MIPPSEEWHLDTGRLGRRVLVYERLGSTNDVAAALAGDPANDGLAVLADEQTAGRGQHGRTWLAGPGQSVLLSVLLFPPPLLRRPAVLTAWAAVSVCSLVEDLTGVRARIKWPNDVLLSERKVCGILIEQAHGRGVSPGGTDRTLSTVVGIGLNVRQSTADFAAAGLPLATSLAAFAPQPPDTRVLAADLLRRMDAEYDRLSHGDLAELEAKWVRHLDLLGKQVTAECHDGTHDGLLCSIRFEGVELERQGTRRLIRPERIGHLEPIR